MPPQFLFNPNNPNTSFNVYVNKNPSDTIPIKYTNTKDVRQTIRTLERLYKTRKYPHKRIVQVGMILMVRLRVIKHLKPNEYTIALRYFEFLKKRTKLSEVDRFQFTFV